MKLEGKSNAVVSEVGAAIVHVDDLKRCAQWYADIFRIPLSPLDDETPFHTFDMDNGVQLMLDDHRNMMNSSRYPICMLKTENSANAYEFVRENGISIVLEPQTPHRGLTYFNIEDCEGNVIMICESDWSNPHPLQPIDPAHPIKNHLQSIVIPVERLNQATEWYSKLLGQPLRPERQDGGPIYWFDMKNGTGILLDDNRNNSDLDAFPTFMLKTDDIHAAYQWMIAQGVEIVRDIQYNHYFMAKDIEGNSLMICR